MKKILSIFINFLLLITLTVPAFADPDPAPDPDPITDPAPDPDPIPYEDMDPHSATCEVNLVIDSNYTLILPATINLKHEPNTDAAYGNIMIGCLGFIPNGRCVKVSAEQPILELENDNSELNRTLINCEITDNNGNTIPVICTPDLGSQLEVTWEGETKTVEIRGGDFMDFPKSKTNMCNLLDKRLNNTSESGIYTSADISTTDFNSDITREEKDINNGLIPAVDFVNSDTAVLYENNGLKKGIDYMNLLDDEETSYTNKSDQELYTNFDNFYCKPILISELFQSGGSNMEGTITFNFSSEASRY